MNTEDLSTPEAKLQMLRDALRSRRTVQANPGAWGAHLVNVLNAFESLDRWLSTGGALPDAWATCRHPSVRSTRQTTAPRPPRPRKPQ